MPPRVPHFGDDELANLFTYHKPFGDQADRYAAIRAGALDLARLIVKHTPPSGEQREAIHYLKLSMMLANQAIAVNEKEPPPPPPKLGIPLGVNLAGPAEWSTDIRWVNACKEGTEWYSQVPGWDYERGKAHPMPLTTQGYPAMLDATTGQFAEQLVYVDMPNHHPAGPFTLWYDGTGQLEINDDGRVTTFPQGNAPVGQGWPVEIRPDSKYVAVRIRKTDARDHVRNVRLVPAEHANRSSPFLPSFLERLKGFKCLRTMDLTMANRAAGVRKWAQRADVLDATYVSRGVPWELVLRLCVDAGAVPWVCVPHEADDDYVRNLASLVGSFNAAQVFVEYSNECWNDEMVQAKWCRQQGRAKGLSGDDRLAGLRFYAARSRDVFRLMADILGPRLVRVVSWNHQDPDGADEACHWAEAETEADVLAVAPYFGHGDEVIRRAAADSGIDGTDALRAASNSLGYVLMTCRKIISDNRAYTQHCKGVADKYGLRLAAYEAGQHLRAPYDLPDDKVVFLTDLFHQANRHPQMHILYDDYVRMWAADGGELMNLFTLVSKDTRDGCWGLLEHADDKGSPKWDAVQALLAEGAAR